VKEKKKKTKPTHYKPCTKIRKRKNAAHYINIQGVS
jgi:hypothetical protein